MVTIMATGVASDPLVGDRIGCPSVREAVETAEGRADRQVPQAQLERYRYAGKLASPGTTDFALQVSLTSLVAHSANAGYLAHWIRHALAQERSKSDGDPSLPQADLVRDIFGNPFRPVAFDPAWRTSTAIALAQQMYESRDFAAMPILADALQEAGCEDEQVLSHGRGDEAHVRGCWVIDLVLGKK